MKFRIKLVSVTALALVCSTPAMAGTDDSPEENLLIGALLGNALSGKTTLGEKAGEVEGWMVVAPLLSSAAIKIGEETKGSKGILVVGAESPDLGLPGRLNTQATLFTTVFGGRCVRPKPALQDSEKFMGILPSQSDLADIVKAAPAPSTAITGYSFDPGDQALVAAMQSQTTGWSRLDDVMVVGDTPLRTQWTALRKARDDYAAKTGCLDADARKTNVERFDALDAKLSGLGEKGEPSVLDQAYRIDALLNGDSAPDVLRVKIEKAGGSIVNTDNIFTRLGYPAIGITGALVVSYRLVNASTGTADKSGLLVCHAPKKTMGALHRGELPTSTGANCSSFSKAKASTGSAN